MEQVLVVYRSKYGFTKTYAEWIAEALHADLKDARQTKPDDLQHYDVIVYGGGLYAGGVNGISLLTKSFPMIQDKSIFLFTVGAADVSDEQNTSHIRSELEKVLSPQMQETIRIYHLRGGIDYPRLTLAHRAMMRMLIGMLRKKPKEELRSEDLAMLETYGQVVDFTDRSSITPLLQDVSSMLTPSPTQE